MNEHQVPEWKDELREYIDKTLKPKKSGMKNLDREIIINFVGNLLSSHHAHLKERVWDLEILENGYGEMFVKLADVKKLLE